MNPTKRAKALINVYCQLMKIEPEDLVKRFGGVINKRIKGARTDVMRCCLSHYLYINTVLTHEQIGGLVSLNRSAVLRGVRMARIYLDNRDVTTVIYYDKLLEAAYLMGFKKPA